MQGVGDSARFPAFQARLFPGRTVCDPGVWFGALVPCNVSPVEDRACPHLWLQSQPCKTERMTKPLHVARGQLCPIPNSGPSCRQKSREMGASEMADALVGWTGTLGQDWDLGIGAVVKGLCDLRIGMA